MAEDVFKLPWIGTEIPKPKPWDLVAFLGVALALALAGADIAAARGKPPGSPLSGALTGAVCAGQLLVSCGSLLVLGKTAKHGTIWGNLAAVAGMLAGLGGVLLAFALWAAA